MSRFSLLALLAGAGIAAHAPTLAAQSASQPPSEGLCLGFAFGTWSPALDWARAGHGGPVDTSRVPRTRGGHDWAIPETDPANPSSEMLLLPVWWPAGVVITLPRQPSAVGDTVTARAKALVGDGRLQSPLAAVRAWQGPCRSAPRR
jgi:hypothetical protein